MAYTTINKSTAYFNTKLIQVMVQHNQYYRCWISTRLVWIKKEMALDNHALFDVCKRCR